MAELDENIEEILGDLLIMPEKLCKVRRFNLAVLLKVRIELLLLLASDEDRRVREEVARCSGKFVNKIPIDVRYPTKPNEVLIRLAKDEDKKVRQEVAQNIHTPGEALVRLARDKDKLVRLHVASNSRAPSEVLTSLTEDENGDVRDRAFRNLSNLSELWKLLEQVQS